MRRAKPGLNPGLVIGGALVLVIALMAALSLIWTPYPVDEIDIDSKLSPPSLAHPLGTDHLGRDMVSMLMAGARISLGVGIVAVFIGMIIGVPLGLMAALKRGGFVDELLTRTNDVIFAFPSLVSAVMITAIFGPSLFNAIIAIGIFNIPVFARLTRGAALSIGALDFILAARMAGKGGVRIQAEHVLPNIAHLLVVQGTIQFSIGVLAEAGLSYVGLGAQPPTPSWGRMLADAQTLYSLAPRLALIPGIAIILCVGGLNLFGDGLRDLFEPRSAGRRL